MCTYHVCISQRIYFPPCTILMTTETYYCRALWLLSTGSSLGRFLPRVWLTYVSVPQYQHSSCYYYYAHLLAAQYQAAAISTTLLRAERAPPQPPARPPGCITSPALNDESVNCMQTELCAVSTWLLNNCRPRGMLFMPNWSFVWYIVFGKYIFHGHFCFRCWLKKHYALWIQKLRDNCCTFVIPLHWLIIHQAHWSVHFLITYLFCSPLFV